MASQSPVFALLLVAFVGDVNPLQQAPGPQDLMVNAIEARKNWTRGHFKVRILTDGNVPNSCWDVWWDGSKQRATQFLGECLREQGSGDEQMSQSLSTTLCVGCVEPETVARFEARPEDKPASTLAIYDQSLLPTNVGWVPDPHVLGLVPCSIFISHGVNVDSYYGQSVRKDFLIADDVLDGYPCVRLTRHTSETELDVWVDPRRSHSVLRARLLSVLPDRNVIDDIRTSYTEVQGLWVPSRSEYSRTVGSQRKMHEVVEIEFESIEDDLPPYATTLSSIPGLKAGTTVTWVMPEDRPSPAPGSALEWNGKAIVGKLRRVIVPPKGPGPGRAFSWLVWLNIACISGIVLAVLIRRYLARRGATVPLARIERNR